MDYKERPVDYKERLVRSVFATALLLSVVGAGCRKATPSQPAPPAPEVSVAEPVLKEIVEWDRYTGRLAAVQSVDVQARVSGYLQSIHFTEGELVEQGHLLFVIDPRPFQATLQVAQAGLAEATAGLSRARAELRQAQAEVEQTRISVALAEKRKARVDALIRQNAVSAEELDLRESELFAARADVDAAEAKAASAEAGIANATAAIESARAAVRSAELDLQYTQVHAPISGRASDWKVDVGNLINGGSSQATPLTTIVQTDPIHAYFDASEQELLKYMRLDREGKRLSSREAKNPVYLGLSDETGWPHRGHMDFVDNRVDPTTGTIRGRAIFANPDHQLVPGLFARLRIPGSARYQAVLVPDSAIGTDQAAQYVLVVDTESRVHRRTVETGPLAHGLRIVQSGLDGSEQIVIRGLQAVRSGSEVVAVEEQLEVLSENELPNSYQPVPPAQWLTVVPQATLVQ